MNDAFSLLLASQSPRRRELVTLLGMPVEVTAADVDESLLPNESPADYVRRLAEAKARAGCPPHPKSPRQVVIGSDTAVADAGEILGKPRDASDAARMLNRLRGRTHQVYTGIAVYEPQSERLFSDISVSDVPMRAYSDAEIAAYIATGDPLDKAGAYAIQHPDFQPVEHFSGCYASVMGLPLCHLARLLKKLGIDVDAEMPQKCQLTLAYECTISAAILRGA